MVVPFGNGLILGYLMYSSGLVPRRMAWLGMIGGPLLLFGNFGVLFDWWDQTGLVSLLVVPEFIWEAFLGIYCAIWGFRKDSPILRPTGAAADSADRVARIRALVLMGPQRLPCQTDRDELSRSGSGAGPGSSDRSFVPRASNAAG